MKTLNEIHDMIQTAQAGDGDRLLDICQALLEQLSDAHRRLAKAKAKSLRENPAIQAHRRHLAEKFGVGDEPRKR